MEKNVALLAISSKKLFLVFTLAIAIGWWSPADAEAVDCGSVELSLEPCFQFVVNNSKDAQPSSDCCSAVKKLFNAAQKDDEIKCLCGLTSNLGLAVNATRVEAVPTLCKAVKKFDPAAYCSAAPAPAPWQMPPPVSTGSPTAPVPSPGPAGNSNGAHCSFSLGERGVVYITWMAALVLFRLLIA